MIEYLTNKALINKVEILSFIHFVDYDFNPRLEGRVNIDNWVDKLFEKADLVIARNNNDIIGLCGFYSNNFVECSAYICYIATSSTYRKQGIATNLLNLSFDFCRAKKMRIIAIHTNNHIAKQLYESIGFTVKGYSVLDGTNITHYYLEKIL